MSLYPNKKNFGIIKSYFRFTFFLLVTSCIIYLLCYKQVPTTKKKEESEMGMKTLRNSTWLLISSIYSQHYIFFIKLL